jgi:hypothetical protein
MRLQNAFFRIVNARKMPFARSLSLISMPLRDHLQRKCRRIEVNMQRAYVRGVW